MVEIFRHEQSDGRSTPQTRLESGVCGDNIMHNTKKRDIGFLRKNSQSGKKHGEDLKNPL